MSEYKTTIGLEIHAELNTKTKMFCNSKNDPDEKRPNVNICPVCLGYPGTLPTINKEAVRSILKLGLAVKGEIADFTEFDRKNYFYPDIPKGYQLSQYQFPLVKGGKINNIELTRIHLEEDTARSSHEDSEYSLVDFNRSSLPLMELVTEPMIHSAEDAGNFARELQLLLQTLGIAEANMEKGEMRVEANISVSKTDAFGTKVEVKNLNSFRAVERAIQYEVKRHIDVLEEGGKIVQETRGWDENKGATFSQRLKEDSHDYRYFPDPDLPKLKISEIPEFQKDVLQSEMPELPWEKRERFKIEYEIKNRDVIELFVSNPNVGEFFEGVAKNLKNDKSMVLLASNYIATDLVGLSGGLEAGFGKITTENFSNLIKMIGAGTIGSRAAKNILAILYSEGGDTEKIATEKGLLQKNDEGELKVMIEKIITDNPKVVAEYKAGKEASLQFLIGQGMKATKGSANPKVLTDLFKKML